MKITIVQGPFLPVPPILGGAVEKVWSALGRMFVKKGHQVTHISRQYGNLPKEETIEGVRHIRVAGFSASRSLLLSKLFDLVYSWRVVRRLPPADILVSNTFWLPVLAGGKPLGRLYVHVARYPKKQLWLYRHAARLQTVSKAVGRVMSHQAPSLKSKIRVIPYPVSQHQLKNKKITNYTETKAFHMLYCGRVHPEKGIHLILKALCSLEPSAASSIKLTIVGPWEIGHGGAGEHYLRRLKRLSADALFQTEWAGPVFETGKLDFYYREADLFLYPSLAEKGETFGLAPLEAMAHGCPALVSALECFEDFIQDNENGFVFNHRQPKPEICLAKKLEQLLKQPELLARTRIKAHETAQKYSIEKVAQIYLEDFHSLMSA